MARREEGNSVKRRAALHNHYYAEMHIVGTARTLHAAWGWHSMLHGAGYSTAHYVWAGSSFLAGANLVTLCGT